MCLKGEGQGSKASFHLPESRLRTARQGIVLRFGHLRGLGAPPVCPTSGSAATLAVRLGVLTGGGRFALATFLQAQPGRLAAGHC